MRVHLCVVGRLKAGPEHALVSDYLTRFEKTGRGLGFSAAQLHEVECRKGGGKPSEAALLRKALPKGATVCVLDERGRVMGSPDFAHQLARWRDTKGGDLAFVIGGADGLDPAFVLEADFALSFGQMVWPHMLARVMLAEQLYRAATILGGGPYHRV